MIYGSSNHTNTNTTINKANLVDQKFKSINGGLSGKYLMESSTKKISYIKGKHKDISLIGNYVNKLMERNKIIHPNIETFRFDVAYKAHDFIENPKKIGKSNIKI